MRVLLAFSLAAAAAFAQKETPPPFATPKPFVVSAGESFTLKNGMKVTLTPYGAVPMVSVRADMAFGRANEAAGQVWLSNLTMQLMREGTAKLSAAQLATEAARMGGQLQLNPAIDQSTAGLDVLSEFAGDAVKLIADVLQHPKFPESEFDRVRNDLARQVSVQLATPQTQATQAFAAKLYPDHPYGRLYPSEAQLKAYTIADVRKFFAANLGAARTHLYLVGRFDPAVKKTIEEAFASWPEGPAVMRNPPKAAPKGELLLLDRPDAVQSTIRMGVPLSVHPGDADYFPLQVTNSLLGGAFISRITDNIREHKGYTYSPFSQVTYRYRTSYWVETADVTTNVTGESLKEIVYEIDRLRKEAPDDRELKNIQNYMNGIFVLQNTSNQGIIGQLSMLDLHGLPQDFLKTYIEKVNRVTRQDVQRIAESYFSPAKMTYVVVGDKAKIEESLKPYPPK